VTGFDALYNPFAAEDTLYLVTDKNAPKKHVIAYDMTNLSAVRTRLFRREATASITLSWLGDACLFPASTTSTRK